MKKILLTIVLLILCAVFIFDASKDIQAKPRLNEKNIKMEVSDSFKLKLKGAKGKVKWKSSKPRFVKVNKNGKVKALKKGKVTITAIHKGKKYRCIVLINKKEDIQNITTPTPVTVTSTPGQNVPTATPDVSVLPIKEPVPSARPEPTATPETTPTPEIKNEEKLYPQIDKFNYFEKWYVKEINGDSITITDDLDIGFIFELKLADCLNVVYNAEIVLGKYDEEFDYYDDINMNGNEMEFSDIKEEDIVDVVYMFYPYTSLASQKRDYCIGINVHRE